MEGYLVLGVIVIFLLVAFLHFLKGKEEMIKVIPCDGDKFHWPYYLYFPKTKDYKNTLLVYPNNTGKENDWLEVHDALARHKAAEIMPLVERLGTILLVPVFPRPKKHWRLYTHALNRDALLTKIPGLERVDLQLIEMIADARKRLAVKGIEVEEKVLMLGFSASGMFSNRFTFLHPEKVKAAAIGAPGGWAVAPLGEWEGEMLPYPVGTGDFKDTFGYEANLEAIKKVPLFFFLGDRDTNDFFGNNNQVNKYFGATPALRWPYSEQIYAASGTNSKFSLYPGVGHYVSADMLNDIEKFLSLYI